MESTRDVRGCGWLFWRRQPCWGSRRRREEPAPWPPRASIPPTASSSSPRGPSRSLQPLMLLQEDLWDRDFRKCFRKSCVRNPVNAVKAGGTSTGGRAQLSRILQRHRSCTSDARGHSEVQQTLILDGSTSEVGLVRRARKETGVRNWPTSKRICGPNPPLGRGGCVQHQVDRSGERPSRGKETPSDADHGAGAGAKRPHGRVAPLT